MFAKHETFRGLSQNDTTTCAVSSIAASTTASANRSTVTTIRGRPCLLCWLPHDPDGSAQADRTAPSQSPLTPPSQNKSAHGIDPTKIQLPCASCKAILNVPHGLSRFSCPQCHVDLAADLSKVKQFFSLLLWKKLTRLCTLGV